MRGHNEGTYYQLPSGKWRVQLSLDGKRISHTGTRTECREWAKKMLGQIEKGLTFEGTRKVIKEFLEEWLMSSKASLRLRTWENYDRVVRRYIIPELGNLKLKDLTPSHIQKFYNNLQNENIGPATIRMIHAVLHRALAYAMELGLIGRNPADPIFVPRRPNHEMKILDENQVSKLLLAAKDNRLEALYYLAVTTGMRQMELLGLKWTDIDWTGNTVFVNRQLLRKEENGSIFSEPKTKQGMRTVALGQEVMQVLSVHYQKQQLDRQIAGKRWKDYGLIFTTRIGTPIDHSNLVKEFKGLIDKAGLPNIRFHDLRHTAISLMLNHGIPVIVVSRRVGHASPSITLDRYGHLIPHMQEEAASLMDKLVVPIEVDLNQ